MKKTPKDLASTPAFVGLNSFIAASALTGIVSNMVTVVKAAESNYDTKIQKSVNPASSPEMTTYTTVGTNSYGNHGYGQDDSKTTTDTF
jgi:hypothetical protein